MGESRGRTGRGWGCECGVRGRGWGRGVRAGSEGPSSHNDAVVDDGTDNDDAVDVDVDGVYDD